MRKLLIALVVIFCGYQGWAQVSKLSINIPKGVYTIKGDYYFDHHNYVTAIDNYSKSVNQNPKNTHAMLRIAEAYRKLNKDDLAGRWYSKAFSVDPNIEEEYILTYISILDKSEKYDELSRWITVYNDRISKKKMYNGTDVYQDSTLVLLQNLKSINSNKSELSPTLYNTSLFFLSNRTVGNNGNYNLYKSVLNPGGQQEGVVPLHETINSVTSEGPIAIAQKTGTLFFTRTDQSQGAKKALTEIFFGDLPATQSGEIKTDKLVIKKFDQGMRHPAVNSEGTLLFFTSKSPENTHGFDLYTSAYTGKKWSTPQALGETINTDGDEMYPTLHNDSILFFASNRHGGLGGFDIYKVNIRDKNAQVEHLNAPINSTSDDFGLILNNGGREGYFASNRAGGLGSDDLYKVYILCTQTKKEVKMAVENEPEELFIYTSKGEEIKLSNSGKGNLIFEFIPGISYTLTMEYDNYKTGTSKPTNNKTNLTERNIYTFQIQKMVETGFKQRNRTTNIQDIHINPGDLITFQLTPNMSAYTDSDDSRIQFNKDEAIIDSKNTIVFSYVAEPGPEIPGTDNSEPLADFSATGKEDKNSSTEPVLGKNTNEPGSKSPYVDTDSGLEPVQPKNKRKDVASIPDTIKTNDVANDLHYPIVTDSLTSAEGIVANENIPLNNPVHITKEVIATTALTTGYLVSDSPDGSNAVAKNESVLDPPSPLSVAPNAMTLQNNESAEQNQSASNNKNDVPNSVHASAGETIQQNKKGPQVPNAYFLSDSASRNKAIAMNNQTLDSSTPTSPQAIALQDNGTVEQNQLGDNKKNVDPSTVRVGAVETLKQDKQGNIDVVPDDSRLSDPADENNAVSLTAKATVPTESPLTNNDDGALGSGENNDFKYRVQIAASVSKMSDAQLKRIYTGSKEVHFYKEDTYYKYYIGETPSYPNARRILNESNVADAFIVAYKGDTKWKLHDAIAFQNSDPSKQAQFASEFQNTDPISVSGNAVETEVQRDKLMSTASSSSTIKTNGSEEDSNHPISDDSLRISSLAPAARRKGIPDHGSEEGSGGATEQEDVSISLDKDKAAIKKSENEDSSKSPTRDYSIRDAYENNDFQYRVQIAASRFEIPDAQLKGIYAGPKEVHFFKEDGYYKYYIEGTPSYYMAKRVLKESDANNAFIVAYKGDIKLKLEDAIALQYKVPIARGELTKSDSILQIVTVNFEFDEFTLLPNERLHLRENVIDPLKNNMAYYAIVNGYTDIRGREEYNFGLSQERALFVEQLIIAEGIRSERVTTRYFGESQVIKYCPENESCDESVHQANRRVEILLLMNKK